jgi:hypothetical protein
MVPDRSSYPTFPGKGYESLGEVVAGTSLALAKGGNPWQAAKMGNKDARRREKKKPKKNKPERIVVSQAAPRIVRDVTGKKP